MNIYTILLTLLRSHGDSTALLRTLESLGSAIAAAKAAIGEAASSHDQEYVDAITDDECDFIEALLGAAYVSTQAQITGVISATKRIHARYERATGGQRLATCSGSKSDILELGGPFLANQRFSRAQVIDAAANYFKHRDEWRGPWATLDPQSARTVAVITAAGATEGSTGNLRAIAATLGNPDFDSLAILHEHVRDWAQVVAQRYRQELAGKGLV